MIRHQRSLIDTDTMTIISYRFKKLESLPRDLMFKPSVDNVYKLHLKLLEVISGKTLNKDNYIQECSAFYADGNPVVSKYFWFITDGPVNFRNDDISALYRSLFLDAIEHIDSEVIHEELHFTVEVMYLFALLPMHLTRAKYEFVDNYDNTLYTLYCLHWLYNFLFNFDKNLSII